MSRTFVTFASNDMRLALERIGRQAEKMGVFDQILTLDEAALDPDFKKRFSDTLQAGIRGYGYWVWKPQVVLQAMGAMNNGDTLLYADAGCHLNVGGRERLEDYFSMLTDDQPLLIFQNDPEDRVFRQINPNIGNWPNGDWCKGDLIDYLDMRDRKDVLEAQTYYATTFAMRKTPQTLALSKKWLSVIEHDLALVDDSPSKAPNLPGFIEHRHDQAIFSLLCHSMPANVISACEIVYPKITGKGADWNRLASFPIHARRDRGNSRFSSLKIRLKAIFSLHVR